MSSAHGKIFISLLLPIAALSAGTLIATYLPLSRDYFNYLAIIDNTQDIRPNNEPGMIILNRVINFLISSGHTSLFYISLVVFIGKYILLAHIVNWRLISFSLILLVYLTRFFPLHELTQIKTALAALFLIAFCAFNARSVKIMTAFLAIMMHIGSSIFLVTYLALRVSRIQRIAELRPKRRVILVVLFATSASLIAFILQQVVIALLVEISPAFNLYYQVEYGRVNVNLLNPALVIDGLLILSFLMLGNEKRSEQTVALAFVLLVGMAVFVSLNQVPSVAFRIRELLSLGVLFLLADMFNSKRLVPRLTAAAFSMTLSSYFYYTFFQSSHRIFDV